MAAGWIEAVRDLWIEDAEINFAALENAWKLQTFETSGGTAKGPAEAASRNRLLCCLTGFDDAELRDRIVDAIQDNGGSYTGDLTRKVTHLIACKPEGKKYAAAKTWNIHTVSIEWLQHSVERSMILDEKCYDPILPPEERGKGAWNRREIPKVSLGKRLRETAAAQEEGRRKLRKTASMKMNSQKDNLWGDILGKAQPVEPPAQPAPEDATQPSSRASFPGPGPGPGPLTSRSSMDTQGSRLLSFAAMEEAAVFSSCCFYTHGFSERRGEILHNSIASLGGITCHSLDEVASASGAQMAHRFVIVPQESDPRSHPKVQDNVQLVTEFFVEKCMYKTQFFDPSTQVIGRPFPVFPIPGFDKLAICTAGFTGVDLNQVDKAIRQLGARYDERFTAQSSLLICSSLSNVRKQKLDLALTWKVPVVSADWLWMCITDGVKVPIKQFLFKELRQRFDAFDAEMSTKMDFDRAMERKKSQEVERKKSQEKARAPVARQLPRGRIGELDASAFDVDLVPKTKASEPATTRKEVPKEDSNATAEFETAPTHNSGSDSSKSSKASLPLSETSQNSLNKPQSPEKRSQPLPSLPTKSREKTPMETADKVLPDDDVPIIDENEPEMVPAEPAAQPLSNPDKPPTRASLPPSERLALSAKLATLFETANPDIAPAPAPAANQHARPVRRRREIFGRAISNVSATSTGSLESSGGVVAADNGAPADVTPLDNREGSREDRNLSSTQVGYDDPEAEMYKKKLMGSYKTLGPQRRTQEGLTLATSGGYDVLAQSRGSRTRRNR